ncbi:MAG: hypothetical protein Q9170_007764 [Blastenia crenularia]
MPLFNLFKNSAHYWVLAGLNIAFFTYRPSSPAAGESNPWITWPSVVLYLIGELGNLNAHIVLRDLRSKNGNERGIPKGLGFGLVTCPNYMFESLAWLGIAGVTWSWSSVLFAAVAIGQMGIWAGKREGRYKREFGKEYARKRAMPIEKKNMANSILSYFDLDISKPTTNPYTKAMYKNPDYNTISNTDSPTTPRFQTSGIIKPHKQILFLSFLHHASTITPTPSAPIQTIHSPLPNTLPPEAGGAAVLLELGGLLVVAAALLSTVLLAVAVAVSSTEDVEVLVTDVSVLVAKVLESVTRPVGRTPLVVGVMALARDEVAEEAAPARDVAPEEAAAACELAAPAREVAPLEAAAAAPAREVDAAAAADVAWELAAARPDDAELRTEFAFEEAAARAEETGTTGNEGVMFEAKVETWEAAEEATTPAEEVIAEASAPADEPIEEATAPAEEAMLAAELAMEEALPATALVMELMAVWTGGATMIGERVTEPVGMEALEGRLRDVV